MAADVAKTRFATVAEYLSAVDAPQLKMIEVLRKAITEVVPQAEEVISYNMPAYKLNSVLVYYAAYEKHIGLYPTPGPIAFFKDKLVGYKTSKGAIQFPVGEDLPVGLIKEIVEYRVREDELKAVVKKKGSAT